MKKGFTLIELMIVVAIIGILGAVAIPKFAELAKKQVKATTFPLPNGFVVDEAHLLKSETVQKLTQKASQIEKSSGAEIAVVTVQSISPLDIETYSIRLAEQWKVGKKGKDNGVILLVALSERKIRIEVGRGFEGALNDAKAGQIINDVISPPLHVGNFDKGISDGFDAIVKTVKGEK